MNLEPRPLLIVAIARGADQCLPELGHLGPAQTYLRCPDRCDRIDLPESHRRDQRSHLMADTQEQARPGASATAMPGHAQQMARKFDLGVSNHWIAWHF